MIITTKRLSLLWFDLFLRRRRPRIEFKPRGTTDRSAGDRRRTMLEIELIARARVFLLIDF